MLYFWKTYFLVKKKKEVSSNKKTYKAANNSPKNNGEPRRNKRAKVAKSFGPDFLTYMLGNKPTNLGQYKKHCPVHKLIFGRKLSTVK